MIATIHQPTYLPYIGFFNKILQSECYVVYDTAQYIKRAFNNRNKIKISGGDSIWLTIPLKKTSYEPFKDIFIDNSKAWCTAHWKSLVLNYSRAKYFSETAHFFEDIYSKKYYSLVVINFEIIRTILNLFEYKGTIVFSSSLGIENDVKATDALIAILKKIGAQMYLSGPSGKKYMDENKFKEAKIGIIYQEFRHPTYNQLWGDFKKHMSTLDLLFNEGIEKSKQIILEAWRIRE